MSTGVNYAFKQISCDSSDCDNIASRDDDFLPATDVRKD